MAAYEAPAEPEHVHRVIGLDPLTDARWESYIASHPDRTVYHHPAWLRGLSLYYGKAALGFACVDAAGTTRGVVAALERSGVVTGRRMTSLPQSLIGAPVADDRVVRDMLLDHLAATARTRGARVEVRLPSGADDPGIEGMRAEPWTRTYALELPDDPDALRFGPSRNHGAVMRAVRHAQREGVVIRDGSTEQDLRTWFDLYLETMRSHASPPRPYSFFEAIWRQLRPFGLCRLLLAEAGGRDGPRVLAGSLLLMFGTTVSYRYNGRRASDLHLRPNDLLTWHALRDAVAAGYRCYDFGETGDEGLAQFKRKWGAAPLTLLRLVDATSGPPRVASAVAGRGLQRRVAGAAWRTAWGRLPLAATEPLGDFARRRL